MLGTIAKLTAKMKVNVKAAIAKPIAEFVTQKLKSKSANGIECQDKIFQKLIQVGRKTSFGKEHKFAQIKSIADFQKQVPIRDYEDFKPYIEEIIEGKENVLWKDRPIYFAKTSGTTSGVKYIPITKDSISNHIDSARNALLTNISENPKATYVSGRMLFLSGSPKLTKKGSIPTGRLSGIVNHHIPSYFQTNRMPNDNTNCIDDWETKLQQIIDECKGEDLRFIGGIPPWIQMFFDKLQAQNNGKTIKEIYPNLQTIMHGGVNFEPYKMQMQKSIGGPIDFISIYPASEGFIAFQNTQKDDSLLLNIDSGIFFEFVPVNEINKCNSKNGIQPTRLTLSEVETGVNYAIILSSNAGLWAYNLGDTIQFVSLKPYRIIVTGRCKHFISAFGEHVINEEVENSLAQVAKEQNAIIAEFTVAPQMQQNNERPYHQWLIEFNKAPQNINMFAKELDKKMRQKNVYYDELVEGNILQTLKIVSLPKGTFQAYMKSIGRLGGQNKIPHLANNRKIVDAILDLTSANVNNRNK